MHKQKFKTTLPKAKSLFQKLQDFSRQLDPGLAQAAIQSIQRIPMSIGYNDHELQLCFSALYLCFAHMAKGYSNLRIDLENLQRIAPSYLETAEKVAAFATPEALDAFFKSDIFDAYLAEIPNPCQFFDPKDEAARKTRIAIAKSKVSESLKNKRHLAIQATQKLGLNEAMTHYAYPSFVRWGKRLSSPQIALYITNILIHLQVLLSAQAFDKSLKDDKTLGNSQFDPLQNAAIAHANQNRFTIVTGGPGTGKTTIIREIIHTALQNGIAVEDIVLAAPTGKAAYRMGESIGEDTRLKDKSFTPMTLHRLLNIRPGRPQGRPSDELKRARIVIVDEFSMIALPIASTLFGALPENCKLIFLGDPEQLPPIDTGNLASLLIADEASETPLATALRKSRVQLKHNFRTSSSPECQGLAEAQTAIQKGETTYFKTNQAKTANELQFSGFEHCADLRQSESILNAWIDAIKRSWTSRQPKWQRGLRHYLYEQRYQRIDGVLPPKELDMLNACFNQLNDYRILSPVNGGIFGSILLNRFVVQRLLRPRWTRGKYENFPVGSLVLLTKNTDSIGHFNGETALVIRLDERVMLAFPNSKATQGYDFYPIESLSQDLQLAFAMSIHKSQGSEFERVLVFLPPGEGMLMTRELFYTAATRAKMGVCIASSGASLEHCLKILSPNDAPCD